MANVGPKIAAYPTLHEPAQGTNAAHALPNTHTHTLSERWLSLVQSLCWRRAGPLQRSSGVRGAICQWKTISGERSDPLVLMSTAGSFRSQRQHVKVVEGWEPSAADSPHTHTHTR